ncbi:MAG: four helix bundle protein [Lewinellaceae bacterium]|nr:four helix bundle protein [Lewinellaceae bacterium]
MATFKTFRDIEAWQLSRELAGKIWDLSHQGTFAKDFELRDHINKTAGSIMDNIAEGFGRGGNREFIQFLCISRGSAFELQSQLCRAFDRKHIPSAEFDAVILQAEKLSQKIHNLLTYLLKSAVKGHKFKEPAKPYSSPDDETPEHFEELLETYLAQIRSS